MLLELKNISKHYGGVTALNDVSLTFAAGSATAIIGGNGAGKSTLMKCITRAETPDHGQIYLDGIPLAGSPQMSRNAGIEMVYQDLQLCPQLTVTENIYLGREERLTICGLPTPFLDKKSMRRNAKILLQKINATVPVERETGKLSGGQRQAVAIARALRATPKLIIFDEPTAALGLIEIQKVIDLISALKNIGIAVIIVSHRLNDAFAVADEIVVLQQGKVTITKRVSETSLDEIKAQLLVDG